MCVFDKKKLRYKKKTLKKVMIKTGRRFEVLDNLLKEKDN